MTFSFCKFFVAQRDMCNYMYVHIEYLGSTHIMLTEFRYD